MCGRYYLDPDGVWQWLPAPTRQIPLFPPRYNIAPCQTAPIIRRVDGKPVFEELRWGFRPSWMKDKNKAQINARSETVFEKPMFKHSALNRRCLVLASGWYEWQKRPDGKQPYAFRLKDHAGFAIAGIWTSWYGEHEAQEDSYSIITTRANPIAAPVHDRMPVILDEKACEIWLDTDNRDIERLAPLLEPFQGTDLEPYPISTYVNSPNNIGEECLRPITGLISKHV